MLPSNASPHPNAFFPFRRRPGSDKRADPYVRATLGAQQLRTKKRRHTLTPRWDETLLFSWDGRDWLYVDVFHRVGKASF